VRPISADSYEISSLSHMHCVFVRALLLTITPERVHNAARLRSVISKEALLKAIQLSGLLV